MNNELLKKYYGEDFKKKEIRIKSYDFLENFLSENFNNYLENKNTKLITDLYLSKLNELSLQEVSFLILHSGYIPDYYRNDSSEETLHTKLTETLIYHWAILIGFNKSILPSQKSSYEDVTISNGKNIIVCDAKSFRLGRSQSSPNVKDTIKLADYEKWLIKYGKKGIGGLITFPSLHDWKKGGDVYQYVSEPQKKVLLLFYEYISFFLTLNYKSKNLIDLINNYPELFKIKSQNKEDYWKKIIEYLFKNNMKDFKKLDSLAKSISQEHAEYKKKLLDKKISAMLNEIKISLKEYKSIDILINELLRDDEKKIDKILGKINDIKDYKNKIKRIKDFRIK